MSSFPYAVFADESYKGVKDARKELDGFTLDTNQSTDNNLIYYNRYLKTI